MQQQFTGKRMKTMRAKALKGPATLERVLRQTSKSPSLVTDMMDDGARFAKRAVRRGRYAAEDVIEEAEHAIKRRPFRTVGWVFAAGVLAGGFLTWFGVRRR